MAIRAPDGANKSINRKIAILLTAKFNRIMLKEIFAQIPSAFLLPPPHVQRVAKYPNPMLQRFVLHFGNESGVSFKEVGGKPIWSSGVILLPLYWTDLVIYYSN